MLYSAHFWTGYGIGEISLHTIRTYKLSVNADNDIEAIEKINKKKVALARFNECFLNNKIIIITCKDKIGLLWLNDKVINWGEDRIYWGLSHFSTDITSEKIRQHYSNNRHSFILSEYYSDKKIEYIFDFYPLLVKDIHYSVDSVINYIKKRYPQYAEQLDK